MQLTLSFWHTLNKNNSFSKHIVKLRSQLVFSSSKSRNKLPTCMSFNVGAHPHEWGAWLGNFFRWLDTGTVRQRQGCLQGFRAPWQDITLGPTAHLKSYQPICVCDILTVFQYKYYLLLQLFLSSTFHVDVESFLSCPAHTAVLAVPTCTRMHCITKKQHLLSLRGC